jgi:sarcosine oxidase subunit beta
MEQQHYDVIVIGAGVIGSSVAFHLARYGARSVLVLDRTQVGAGTTSQSSGILRTHYSVPENVALAQASWKVFEDFAGYIGDEEASAGPTAPSWSPCAPRSQRSRRWASKSGCSTPRRPPSCCRSPASTTPR